MLTEKKVDEKPKSQSISIQKDLAVTKNNSTDLKIWKSSTQLSKNNNNGQPSYADYENYFYI